MTIHAWRDGAHWLGPDKVEIAAVTGKWSGEAEILHGSRPPSQSVYQIRCPETIDGPDVSELGGEA